MNRFEDRIEEGFDRFAGHATPSSTAFETFRTRIVEEADQPEVEIIMLQKNEELTSRRGFGWMQGVAAAAFILVAVFAAILFADRNDQTVIIDQSPVPSTVAEDATPEPLDTGAVEIAMNFLDARNAYDAEAVMALIAAAATMIDPLFQSSGGNDVIAYLDPADVDWVASADFERVTGNLFTDISCEETEPGTALCGYSWENDWTRALEVAPESRMTIDFDPSYFDGSTVVFGIEDGQIRSIKNGFRFVPGTGGVDDVFTEMQEWIKANRFDPDEFLSLYNTFVPARTADVIPLWETYTDEFVAYYTAPDE